MARALRVPTAPTSPDAASLEVGVSQNVWNSSRPQLFSQLDA